MARKTPMAMLRLMGRNDHDGPAFRRRKIVFRNLSLLREIRREREESATHWGA